MTDYEMLSITVELVNTVWAIFATYVSIVFAFLVASYLVAQKLAPRIVSIVITLYTLVALWAVFGLNRTMASLSAAIGEIKRAVLANSSSLDWYPGASIPDVISSAFPILITIIAVIAYFGSLAFFFHQRRVSSSGSTLR